MSIGRIWKTLASLAFGGKPLTGPGKILVGPNKLLGTPIKPYG